jgi:hypothetical protein
LASKSSDKRLRGALCEHRAPQREPGAQVTELEPGGPRYPWRIDIGGAMTTNQPTASTLPQTREELLVLHNAARQRRIHAEPGSHEWEQASAEVGRIEIEIARIERDMTPPKM